MGGEFTAFLINHTDDLFFFHSLTVSLSTYQSKSLAIYQSLIKCCI